MGYAIVFSFTLNFIFNLSLKVLSVAKQNSIFIRLRGYFRFRSGLLNSPHLTGLTYDTLLSVCVGICRHHGCLHVDRRTFEIAM